LQIGLARRAQPEGEALWLGAASKGDQGQHLLRISCRSEISVGLLTLWLILGCLLVERHAERRDLCWGAAVDVVAQRAADNAAIWHGLPFARRCCVRQRF
jgi:hypothetical protein